MYLLALCVSAYPKVLVIGNDAEMVEWNNGRPGSAQGDSLPGRGWWLYAAVQNKSSCTPLLSRRFLILDRGWSQIGMEQGCFICLCRNSWEEEADCHTQCSDSWCYLRSFPFTTQNTSCILDGKTENAGGQQKSSLSIFQKVAAEKYRESLSIA